MQAEVRYGSALVPQALHHSRGGLSPEHGYESDDGAGGVVLSVAYPRTGAKGAMDGEKDVVGQPCTPGSS